MNLKPSALNSAIFSNFLQERAAAERSGDFYEDEENDCVSCNGTLFPLPPLTRLSEITYAGMRQSKVLKCAVLPPKQDCNDRSAIQKAPNIFLSSLLKERRIYHLVLWIAVFSASDKKILSPL